MSSSGKRLILVIEDHADSRKMLTLLLESWNYRVLVAPDGRHALKVAGDSDVDLIVTDFGLPDIDGLEIIRQLRCLNARLSRIPIIMLTAVHSKEIFEAALSAGCTEFMNKPADFDTLQAMITRLLSDRYETDEDTHRSVPLKS